MKIAQYLLDVGANYLWQDDATRGSNSLGFEAVYKRGRSAHF